MATVTRQEGLVLAGPCHGHENDIILFILGRLPVNRLAGLIAHLESCGACAIYVERALVLAEQPSTEEHTKLRLERRRSSRVSTGGTGLLWVLNFAALTFQRVRLVDLSTSGVRIRAAFAPPVNSIVHLSMRNYVALAEVCYCHPVDLSFSVGLKLQVVHSRKWGSSPV